MTRLTNHVKLGDAKNNLEELLLSREDVIDAGFNLEIYGNWDGKTSDSARGSSLFVHMDQDVEYGHLLDSVDHMGEVRDDSLAIRTVGADEAVELGFCKENPVSLILRAPTSEEGFNLMFGKV
jgi:hypothetical protein